MPWLLSSVLSFHMKVCNLMHDINFDVIGICSEKLYRENLLLENQAYHCLK